ncbi:MAG: hypothetical protein ACI8PB_001452 [Desulforhopalus sp.]|jgi:hypothetical protein
MVFIILMIHGLLFFAVTTNCMLLIVGIVYFSS